MGKWISLFLIVWAVLGCGNSQTDAPEPQPKTPPKTGANLPKPSPYEQAFHPDDLQPRFEKISQLVSSGFSGAQAETLAADIRKLKKGEKKDWSFNVKFKDKEVTLKVYADTSQGDWPIVRFDAPDKDLLESISKVM
jgi:hypothetical protein